MEYYEKISAIRERLVEQLKAEGIEVEKSVLSYRAIAKIGNTRLELVVGLRSIKTSRPSIRFRVKGGSVGNPKGLAERLRTIAAEKEEKARIYQESRDEEERVLAEARARLNEAGIDLSDPRVQIGAASGSVRVGALVPPEKLPALRAFLDELAK